MEIREMNCWEFEEHIKDNMLDNSKFMLTNDKGGLFFGNVLDSAFGMIQINELGKGFIRFKEFRQIKKENDLKFTFVLLPE